MSDVSDNCAPVVPASTEEFYARHFDVFNPPGTIGVRCDGRGRISDVMLETAALTDDEALGEEIVAIARLARAKQRMELRLFTLQSVQDQGRNPDRMDRFCRNVQKLPTPEEYQALEAAEFATRYPA